MRSVVKTLLFCAIVVLFSVGAEAAPLPNSLQGITTTQLMGVMPQANNYSGYQYVTTNGYYSAGDAGGGVTYYNAHTTTCTPDGGSVVQDQNAAISGGSGNCWYATKVPDNIFQWGAVANAPTNNALAVGSTTQTDNRAFFEAAINALESATGPGGVANKAGGTLYIPCTQTGAPGNPTVYALATSINPSSNVFDLRDHPGVTIVGCGSGNTMIKAIPNTTTGVSITSPAATWFQFGYSSGTNRLLKKSI